MANLTSAAKNIFDDLLTLEVNVVLKPGMTARKLPEPVQALLDVMGDYDNWMAVFAARLNPVWMEYRADASRGRTGPPQLPARTLQRVWSDGGLIAAVPYEPICEGDGTEVTEEAFDKLRERARTAEVMLRLLLNEGRFPGGDDGSGMILKRIYRNCDQIKGVLSRQASADAMPTSKDLTRQATKARVMQLSADDVLIVRKVWEVGTESIAMQTVAQIDGDVVTRIQAARATLADQPIHDLHREAVGNAMKHWQFLVETLVTVTTKAAGFLFR
jgi:hypothetical protein